MLLLLLLVFVYLSSIVPASRHLSIHQVADRPALRRSQRRAGVIRLRRALDPKLSSGFVPRSPARECIPSFSSHRRQSLHTQPLKAVSSVFVVGVCPTLPACIGAVTLPQTFWVSPLTRLLLYACMLPVCIGRLLTTYLLSLEALGSWPPSTTSCLLPTYPSIPPYSCHRPAPLCPTPSPSVPLCAQCH